MQLVWLHLVSSAIDDDSLVANADSYDADSVIQMQLYVYASA